ncbi:protease PrsW [Acrasis kona]|uniref:Protease PrsW n=1 Tax=Acrasis kona TaxID=1008807 RepID=A0AAW2Z0I1_9EUKA
MSKNEEVTVHIDAQLNASPQSPVNNYEDYDDEDSPLQMESVLEHNHKRLGICFWFTIVAFIAILLSLFILSPISGVLSSVACFPAVMILFGLYIFKRDTLSMELSLEMFWGGVFSVVIVFIIELLIGVAYGFAVYAVGSQYIDPKDINALKELMQPKGQGIVSVAAALFNSFVVASMVEETTKYILSYRVSHEGTEKHKVFYHSGPESAMIYSAVAALGLATFENVGYVLADYFSQTNGGKTLSTLLESGIYLAILRILTAVPIHVLNGCLIGLFFWRNKGRDVSFHFLRVIWLPFIIHGLYDFILLSVSLMNSKLGGLAILLAFVMVVISSTIVYILYNRYKQLNRQNLSSSILNEVMVDSDDDEEEYDERVSNRLIKTQKVESHEDVQETPIVDLDSMSSPIIPKN